MRPRCRDSDRRARPVRFRARGAGRHGGFFRRELRAVEGIHAALDAIRLPTCVASSGPPEKIRLSLELTGLLPRFDGRIFSAYEVGSWKPDPGLFLHAAEAMGVPPDECAVVEDSVPGVRAGVAAGMRVFAYAPHGAAELEGEIADERAVVFDSMLALPRLLAT